MEAHLLKVGDWIMDPDVGIPVCITSWDLVSQDLVELVFCEVPYIVPCDDLIVHIRVE